MAGLRIGGLASGMDIDQIVGDLMRAERMPLDKLKQKKQVLEWQRDDYRSMNSLLLNFRNELGNMRFTTKYRARSVSSTNSDLVTATASSAAAQASYTISKITSLASAATKVSGSSMASANKTIDASKSLYSQKDAIDSGTFTWSDGVIGSQILKADGVKKDYELTLNTGEQIKLAEINKMSVKVNGKAYKIIQGGGDPPPIPSAGEVILNADGKLNFSDVIPKDANIEVDYILSDKIETKTLSAGTTSLNMGATLLSEFSIEVTPKDGTPSTYSLEGGADADGFIALTNPAAIPPSIGRINLETGQIKFDDGAIAAESNVKMIYKQRYSSFDLTTEASTGLKNDKFLISANDSLNEVISKVNSSDIGLTMFFDSYSGKVSLTRNETGNFKDGTLTAPGDDQIKIAATDLFLTEVLNLSSTTVSSGANASFTINGMDTSRSTNTFEMNGVTFTLKQTTNADPTKTASLTISNDTNAVFENIKTFVDKYNEMIDKIQKKTSEQYYRDYKPLTDEQRESLSETQQEQWEEKAKSGLLKRDPILSEALDKMRRDFYGTVENSAIDPMLKQLTSIGISTTNIYREGGKLEIDDAVLKKALEDNPESVENLFRGTGTTSSEQGIVHRLFDTVTQSMDKLRERAGSSNTTTNQFALGRQMDNVDDQIDRFESRLKQMEDRYWRQFTAMEKAIQRSNEQAMFFMQQFGGGY